MKNVLALPTPVADKAVMLENLDDLRQRIESGEVVAFAAVGIAADHGTSMWSGSAQGPKVSRLMMIGAMQQMLYCYQADT